MKVKTLLFVTILILSHPICGWSQTADEIKDWDQRVAMERAALPKLVKTFSDAIGCNVTFDPRNVVRWHGDPQVSYVALVALDEGCSGGSRSWRSVFVAIRTGAYGKLYINLKYSSPEFTSFRFPQTIDSISSLDDKVTFLGRRVKPGDPDSSPSERVSGVIFWSGTNWSFQ